MDGEETQGNVGGDTTAAQIRDARLDPKVKAIVLRVNSPGGSVTASEVIRAELAAARAAGKPVVVSMGGMAASGGLDEDPSLERYGPPVGRQQPNSDNALSEKPNICITANVPISDTGTATSGIIEARHCTQNTCGSQRKPLESFALKAMIY